MMDIDIVLLAATDMELRGLLQTLRASPVRHVAGKPWHRGEIADRRVLLVQTGIGAVNAAHALTCVLQAQRPSFVLQCGVAGAYPDSGLDVGDIAVATEEVYADLGVITPDGWQPADAIGIPLVQNEAKYYNRFPVDQTRTVAACEIIRAMHWEEGRPNVRSGPFLTVQQCSGVAAVGNALAARCGGICENMEGAAAAHVCLLYDAPFVEVRAMSNRVEDRNPAAWNLPIAVKRAQQAAAAVMQSVAL